jgi:S-DNA-T family DNA segregation ATPase FtsK/SpoIIIE
MSAVSGLPHVGGVASRLAPERVRRTEVYGIIRRQLPHRVRTDVLDIAARRLGYDIHLVLTASHAMEVRANLADRVTNRLELRLRNTMDAA